MSKKLTLLILLLAAAGLLFLMLLFPKQSVAQSEGGAIARISEGFNGAEANDVSDFPAVSADGRYVAFYSQASNLVANDTNARRDAFVYDRQTGLTSLVSVASNGSQANQMSGEFSPLAISADGRHVAFTSFASNLVPNDTNNTFDIFVHDRQTGATVRVSVDQNGDEGPFEANFPDISATGRFVVFLTRSRLDPADTNSLYDVYVHDRDTDNDGIFDEPGAIRSTMVSIARDGTMSNNHTDTSHLSISADGRHIAFASFATNLVNNDTNGQIDIFYHDRDTDNDGIFDEPGAINTARASIADDNTQANGPSHDPDISGDGRFVAFSSDANNLVLADVPACNGSNCTDVFVFDRDTDDDGIYDEDGATGIRRVSVTDAGAGANGHSRNPAINQDGSVVVFSSLATNLGDIGTVFYKVFSHELATGTTSLISEGVSGIWANNHAWRPAISGDGRLIAFSAMASNLIPGDTNGVEDAFIWIDISTPPTPTPTQTATPPPTPSPTPSVQPPGEGWQQQTLAVRGTTGVNAAIGVDSQGHPHISFEEQANGQSELKYTYWDGVIWHTATLDSGRAPAISSDLVIRSDDHAAVSYQAQDGSLVLATWDGVGWSRETVNQSPGAGNQIAMAASPVWTYPEIVHYNAQTGELQHTYHELAWVTNVITDSVSAGTRPAIAFDSHGNTGVVFFKANVLWYARFIGFSWQIEPVLSTSGGSDYASLVYSDSDQPHISFYNAASDNVVHVYKDGAWQNEAVNPAGVGGRHTQIAFDASGTLLISFLLQGDLYLAANNGAGFDLEILDTNLGSGASADMAMGSAGTPHFAYHDFRYGDLNYLTWGPHWELRTVLNGADLHAPALALDQTVPGVSYYDGEGLQDEMVYSAWENIAWSYEPSIVNDSAAVPTDLGYGADGQPRIAALTEQMQRLTYRRWDGFNWQTEIIEEVTTGDLGHEVTLLLDDAEQPIIIYTLNDGASRRIRLAQWDGSNWQFSTNMVSPPLGNTYELSAGRLANRNNIYVSYYEMGGGDLRLATWNGASWQDQLVDDGAGADTGRFPALALDVRYVPDQVVEVVAIAYFNATDETIRYSVRNTSWETHVVVPDAGAVSSLDMILGNDSWLKPYIAYTTATDNSLRLAYSVDGLHSFPQDIILTGAVPPDQVSLAFDYAPRLAFRGETGQLQYAFPGSRHHIGTVPTTIIFRGDGPGFDPNNCLFLLEYLLSGLRGPAGPESSGVAITADEAVVGAMGFLFARTDSGRAYLQLYADHVGEMAQITWSDPALAWDAYLTLENLMPGLEALVNDSGDEVMVT
ncbi:MAG: hypothetical protein KDE34_13385, partial [Anaerolineales bacterium]|nr:hypothetical protein [Anaerolineales bacterium]